MGKDITVTRDGETVTITLDMGDGATSAIHLTVNDALDLVEEIFKVVPEGAF